MTKPFLELFKKYEPSDSEKNIISKIVGYSVKADKEARIISCDVEFDGYIPISPLLTIENRICEAYDLQKMLIQKKQRNLHSLKEVLFQAEQPIHICTMSMGQNRKR